MSGTQTILGDSLPNIPWVAIYHDAADTVTCLAFTQVDVFIDFIKANSL